MGKRLVIYMLVMVLFWGNIDIAAFAVEHSSNFTANEKKQVDKEEIVWPQILENSIGTEKVILKEWLSANGIQEESGAPILTSVILSMNEGQLRIRAWSATADIKSVEASIYCKSGTTTWQESRSLQSASGYYTSQLFIGRDVEVVRVVVAATNTEGKTGYKAAQLYPKDSELEAERVSNDLWIRFLDGEGKESSEYTYSGKAIKPRVEIYEGTVLLTEKKDYTLSYKNNKNAGLGTLIVKGKGNYKKTAQVNFTIKPKNLKDEDIIVGDFSAVVNGKRQEKIPSITFNKKKLSNKKEKDFTVIYEDVTEGAYKEPGKYPVKIIGNGNYTGDLTIDFSVAPKLVKNLKVSKIEPVNYTGQSIVVDDLEIKDGKTQVPLEKFTITYRNNVEAGTASIVIEGDGKEYAGTRIVNFTIVGTPLKTLTSVKGAFPKEEIYQGGPVTPLPNLFFQEKPLIPGQDYLIEYKNNQNAGTATMVLTGKGRFTGVVKHSFKVKPFDASVNEGGRLTVTFEGENEQGELLLPFIKGGVKPKETVKFEGRLLTAGKDYTVAYQNNKSVTTEETAVLPKVIIKMKGNYTKSLEKTFVIFPQELENTKIVVQDVVLGKKKFSWKSKVAITDLDGKKLIAGKDYEKAIGYFTDAMCQNEATEETYPVSTTLWVKIKGAGSYEGSEAIVSYQVKEATLSKAKVKIRDKSYTGEPITISDSDIVSVKVGDQLLTAGQDFEILTNGYSNNIKKGTAKVTLKGINDYGGTITANFKIVQKDFRWREKLEDNQTTGLYEATLSETTMDKFAEKNASISFRTKILLQPDTQDIVTAVKINGTNYPLTRAQDGFYQANIPSGNKAGNVSMEVTAITVAGEECAVSWKGSGEVLKDIPRVENGVWQETENGKLEFTFTVTDEDHAMLEGSRVVVFKEGQQLTENQLQEGNNKISFTSSPQVQYQVAVLLNYDRDSNQSNGLNEERNKEVYTSRKTAGGITYEILLQNPGVSDYVEKNEKLTFFTGMEITPDATATAMKINGTDYLLTKSQDGLYSTQLPGSSNAGRIPVKASGVTINEEEYNVNWEGFSEVLKDIPVIENPVWTEKDSDKLEFNFSVKDQDNALKEGTCLIMDTSGETVTEKEVESGNNKLEFAYEAGTEYRILVKLSYDRDEDYGNGKNEEREKEVYTELKVVPKEDSGDSQEPEDPKENELLELTGITSVMLYYQGEEVSHLDISQGTPQNPENYMVKIESERAKDLYLPVEELVKEGEKLRVIPKLSGFIHYEEEGNQIIQKENLLLYADNVTSGISSIQELCDAIQNGETNITLTKDLDASGFSADVNSVIEYFEGTLNGAGHTIYNLRVPLFQDIYNATIKNLNIKNADIKGKTAILAAVITRSTVENVNIIDSVIDSPTENTVGGIGGMVYYDSSIKNCNLDNIRIKAAHTIGGVAGRTELGGVIEKVVVSGILEGCRQGNEGTWIGGICGFHLAGSRNSGGPQTAIKNSYAQVVIQAPIQTGNGGLIGGPDNTTAGVIENSIAYTKGICHGIAGFNNYLGTITNVFQMVSDGVIANTSNSITTIESIDQEKITALGIPEKAWEFYLDSNKDNAYWDSFTKIEGYREERKNAYENLLKLAYVMDRKELVAAGNALNDTDLVQKQIKQIYPVSQEGKYVVGLIAGEEETLTKILVEFTDGSRKEISLSYAFTAGGLVAVYHSDNPAITYHFDKYVCKAQETLKNELLSTLQSYDYGTDLDPLTDMADRRQYKDYYQENTVNQLEEFVTLQLISQEEYPFYVENDALKNNLKEKLTEQLPELLYTYNYVNKWYDFDIGSLNPSLLLYFDGEKLSEFLTQEQLVESIIEGDCSDTHQTYLFFDKYLKPRTAGDLYSVLENLITVAGYQSADEWFKNSYDGILREQTALQVSEPSDYSYRIWENLTRIYGEKSVLLPILTAPQEDMILVSAPSQVFISSINRYHTSNSPQTKAAMEATLDNFCNMLGTYFGSLINIIPGAGDELNSRVIINYDTVKDFKNSTYSGIQQEGISEEPVYKWVYESVRRWKDIQSAAYTWDGSEIFFVDTSLFGEYVGFRIFTHENAHAQDGTLFYLGNGRRVGAGAEFHADGVLAQDFVDGTMTFNLSKEINYKEDVIVNLSPQRINTPEKLHDYYKDMFDVNYVLDYLIGKAFLKLTPAEQSKVAVKAYEYSGGSTMSLSYGSLTESALQEMNLTSIDDLIANKLSIISKSFSGSMSGYYVESFWNIKWYQPNNPNGAADEASFKGFSHEMLGYAGYENGFVPWLSGKSQNDLDALRQITKDSTMDFVKYKRNRYAEVEEKLSQIPWFNTEEVIDQFVEALRQDGGLSWVRNTTELKKIYYQTVKRATNDFTDGNIYEAPKAGEVSTAQQLAEILQADEAAYVKLTAHIDMSQLSSANGYYFENFSGVIDGNGYELYGMKAPLFNHVTLGRFKNIHLDVSGIKENQGTGILSRTTKHLLVDGLQYEKSLGVPLTTEGVPIGWIYKIYNEIGEGEAYVSPRIQ